MTKYHEGDWVKCVDDTNSCGAVKVGEVYRVIGTTGGDELLLEGIEKPYRYWNSIRFERAVKTFVIGTLES